MDVLSSQSNLAGYRAVIDSAYHVNKVFPMFMTAAGTVFPAKVLVLGVGVAGLQAIATAKRLGASVFAFDVRRETKEQVESLGASFIEVPAAEDGSNDSGYAKEMSEDYKRKQAELINEKIAQMDIVITTALIPGKKSPILVTKEMVEKMKAGSVIYDLAAVGGGNCEMTKPGEITTHNEVTIIGYKNIPSRASNEASKLYSKNLFNFLSILTGGDYQQVKVNLEDELISKTILCHDGQKFNLV
jgi:NAD(P) transhydrogenase subunit alpha